MIADTQINSSTQNIQSYPSVTMLTDGGFVLSWHSVDQDGSADGIYAQRYDENGVAEGSEFRVNTYTIYSQWDPAIAALNDGGFVVSWTSDQNGYDSGIYAQRFNATGMAQGDEFRVNTYTDNNQLAPEIATLKNGSFVVSWVSDIQDGSGAGVYAQCFNANGVVEGEEFRVNTYTYKSQSAPAITALAGGDFVVSWGSDGQDGSSYGIYAQRYNANGVAQGDEFRVNTFTDGDQNSPAITALNDGGFVVSWHSYEQDGSDYGIYAQRFNATGIAQDSEFRVNTFTDGYQRAPAITALSKGGFVVSWESTMGDVNLMNEIYAQRFNANGVAEGNEFRVNTYTISNQYSSAITTLADGGFIVSWTSFGQDGDADGIFAHRYNASGNEIGWTAADRLFNWGGCPEFCVNGVMVNG